MLPDPSMKLAYLISGLFLILLLPSQVSAQVITNEESVEYVLDRYIEAMGGRASLEGIKSVRLSGKIRYPSGLEHSITVLKKKPDLVRVVLDTGTVRFIQAYDGKQAWFSRQAGRNAFYDRMRGNLAAGFLREAPLENVLVNPRDTGAKIYLGEDVQVARVSCYQVIADFPDGSRIIHYIEKETFLERRILEYNEKGELVGDLIPSKFETFQSVLFALQILRMKDGKVVSNLQLEDVEINVGILDTPFTPPVELPPN
jgi:outer membrane lipoprotein-sorting protein